MKFTVQKVAAWICLFCIAAALIWRLIMPWTGFSTDLVFLGIFAAGIVAGGIATVPRRQQD